MSDSVSSKHPNGGALILVVDDFDDNRLLYVSTIADAGYRVDYALAPAKVAKQFQTAEQLGARVAILFGDEWPQVAVKNLATGEQVLITQEQLLTHLAPIFSRSS